MRQAIPHFYRFLKGVPLLAAGEAQQDDGARSRHAAQDTELAGLGVKGTAYRETPQSGAPT